MTKIASRFVRGIVLLLILATLATPTPAKADVSLPQTDQTPLAPLPTSPALPVSLDYVSGVSLGAPNSYAIFYENKSEPCVTAGNPPYRMYTAQTSSGPLGLGAPTAMDICNSHFIAKDWPIAVGAITYAYRGWGAGNYNGTHNFYASNDRIHWTLVGTFTFSHPSDGILYGFHDIVRINGHYLGFVESAGGHTYIVQNTHFDSDPAADNNFWTVIDPAVGGIGLGDHLLLPGSSGPKPTGNLQLMTVAGELVYGKLYLPGNSAAAYLMMNATAGQAPTPAAAEAAFLNVNNWIWSNGASGATPAASAVLTATAAHNVRTAWVPPMPGPESDYVILYSGEYSSPIRRALGCAASSTECLLPEQIGGGTNDAGGAGDPAERLNGSGRASFIIPVTGFPPGLLTDVGPAPAVAYDYDTGVTLNIPKLKLTLPVVGVPQKHGTWTLDWLSGAGGWLEGTAFPGLQGNSVITSHVVTHYGAPGPFERLRVLSTGDYVFVNAFGRTYIYEVKAVVQVAADDLESVFGHATKPVLTLMTCSRFNEAKQIYDGRLVVRSELIQVGPLIASPR